MTAIEHLRRLAERYKELGKDHTTIDVVPSGMAMLFSSIANQIEREHAEDCYRMVIDHGTVSRVASDMERHILGHEGMEDSPVARWARELREALGGRDEEVTDVATVRKDAYDAYEWVCENGGLAAVKLRWECLSYYADPVPRACMERRLASRQRQIDESHAALRRRNERIAELERRAAGCASSMLKSDASYHELQRAVLDQCRAFGVDVSKCDTAYDMLHDMNEALSKRLMPEGMEWPRYESGEPVRIGDAIVDGLGNAHEVSSVEVFDDAEALHWIPSEPEDFVWFVHGERVRQPASQVLDADGVEIRVGDTVYEVDTGEKMWVCALPKQSEYSCVKLRLSNGMSTALDPFRLTHRASVFAADGSLLRVGETVYEVEGTGHAYKVVGIRVGDGDPLTPTVVTCDVVDGTSEHFLPSQLTHELPDSWERLEDDANKNPFDYCKDVGHTCENSEAYKAHDLVRRAKALAGVGK